jgi:3,4-dihydroxy-2-butanone 4-phosphate synthase
MLNTASLRRSALGLVAVPLTEKSFLPLNFPLMILNLKNDHPLFSLSADPPKICTNKHE